MFSEKQKQLDNQNFWEKYVVSNLIKKVYHDADHIINQCHSMREDLLKIYPKINYKTSVIFNPIAKNIIDYKQ